MKLEYAGRRIPTILCKIGCYKMYMPALPKVSRGMISVTKFGTVDGL